MQVFANILVNSIAMGIIFLYGCIGETITEKVGNLNLGIPGIMCIGAAGGGLAVSIYGGRVSDPNAVLLVLLAILSAMIFAGIGGLIYAFLTVTMKANQNVTGLALTTFGIGFMKFFAKRMYDQPMFVRVSKCFKNFFGLQDSQNIFCKIFLSHGVLVYLAIVIAIAAALFLKKTRTGLYLRAIGENPATADAAGINVTKYKYVFISIGSAIAGLGGLYYVMDRSSGTQFAEAAIDSFGWLAVALVIATMWKPAIAIIGSIIFGGLSILDVQLPVTLSGAQQQLFAIVPYLITVLVLIVTSVMDRKDNQPPASLGINYYREDR